MPLRRGRLGNIYGEALNLEYYLTMWCRNDKLLIRDYKILQMVGILWTNFVIALKRNGGT